MHNSSCSTRQKTSRAQGRYHIPEILQEKKSLVLGTYDVFYSSSLNINTRTDILFGMSFHPKAMGLGHPSLSHSFWPLCSQYFLNKNQLGASLVARWLRTCLPMQGTRVRALVWEDPTCRGATRPVSYNYWACASGACAPQQERPR